MICSCILNISKIGVPSVSYQEITPPEESLILKIAALIPVLGEFIAKEVESSLKNKRIVQVERGNLYEKYTLNLLNEYEIGSINRTWMTVTILVMAVIAMRITYSPFVPILSFAWGVCKTIHSLNLMSDYAAQHAKGKKFS